MIQKEGIMEVRDDVDWRTLQKGGMMQEDNINGRVMLKGGYYKREG